MSFPDRRFRAAGDFADAYFSAASEAAASVDSLKLQQAAEILISTHRAGGIDCACGNGGSAAIANHLVCDHCKLVQTDTDLTPRIVSLSATVEIITAIGNDLTFDDVFSYQLKSLARTGDALITISSSGDSENIVTAARWANQNEMPVISMTGFSGGRSAELATINLHVDADNYGIIEDVHQSLMHILAQFIRQAHMDEDLIPQRKF